MSRYQKGKTNLNFTEARDSEWQRHQLSHIQVCMSLQTDNHASTAPVIKYITKCKAKCFLALFNLLCYDANYVFVEIAVIAQIFNSVAKCVVKFPLFKKQTGYLISCDLKLVSILLQLIY